MLVSGPEKDVDLLGKTVSHPKKELDPRFVCSTIHGRKKYVFGSYCASLEIDRIIFPARMLHRTPETGERLHNSICRGMGAQHSAPPTARNEEQFKHIKTR